jgi:hypothetical protein
MTLTISVLQTGLFCQSERCIQAFSLRHIGGCRLALSDEDSELAGVLLAVLPTEFIAGHCLELVVQHITGVADKISFAGLGGFDGRDDFLSFGDVDAPRRAFQFEQTGTDAAVIVSFNPSMTGVDPGSSGEAAIQTLSKVVARPPTKTQHLRSGNSGMAVCRELSMRLPTVAHSLSRISNKFL